MTEAIVEKDFWVILKDCERPSVTSKIDDSHCLYVGDSVVGAKTAKNVIHTET